VLELALANAETNALLAKVQSTSKLKASVRNEHVPIGAVLSAGVDSGHSLGRQHRTVMPTVGGIVLCVSMDSLY
jgi:hypothetical protein